MPAMSEENRESNDSSDDMMRGYKQRCFRVIRGQRGTYSIVVFYPL